MTREAEALNNLRLTLEKYKKNKENVSKEDLEGKYKKSFDKLKAQLSKEAEAYIIVLMFQGMHFYHEYIDETVEALMDDINARQIGKRVGRAVFKNYDLDEVKAIALEQRDRNIGIILKWRGALSFDYDEEDNL